MNLKDDLSKHTIYIDGWCNICRKFKYLILVFDIFNQLNIKDIRLEKNIDNRKIKEMYSVNSVGKEFYGFQSLYEISKILFILWITFPLMFFLRITKLGDFLYFELSQKRKIIKLSCDDNCDIYNK